MADKRIPREKKGIEKMIKLYCRDKHQTKGDICSECRELKDYAMQRLSHCKFGEDKPTCGKCPIHCYRKDMREKVIAVMRYSGPRMLFRHPVLAVMHLIDGRRQLKEN